MGTFANTTHGTTATFRSLPVVDQLRREVAAHPSNMRTCRRSWRARASKEYPSAMRRMQPHVRYILLTTLWNVRQTEITDTLVDLFIQLVMKINTRAEKQVEGEFCDAGNDVRKDAVWTRQAAARSGTPDHLAWTPSTTPRGAASTPSPILTTAR